MPARRSKREPPTAGLARPHLSQGFLCHTLCARVLRNKEGSSGCGDGATRSPCPSARVCGRFGFGVRILARCVLRSGTCTTCPSAGGRRHRPRAAPARRQRGNTRCEAANVARCIRIRRGHGHTKRRTPWTEMARRGHRCTSEPRPPPQVIPQRRHGACAALRRMSLCAGSACLVSLPCTGAQI